MVIRRRTTRTSARRKRCTFPGRGAAQRDAVGTPPALSVAWDTTVASRLYPGTAYEQLLLECAAAGEPVALTAPSVLEIGDFEAIAELIAVLYPAVPALKALDPPHPTHAPGRTRTCDPRLRRPRALCKARRYGQLGGPETLYLLLLCQGKFAVCGL